MPHSRRAPLRRLCTVAAACGLTISLAGAAGTATATAGASTPSTSGVTLNFADLFKQAQTIFQATGTLDHAPYKVSYSEFTSGPPIVAAESGGSVDLGVMAETPTIFAQEANDPVKVVAAVEGTAKSTPYALMLPTGSPVTKLSELRGKTIAVQEGTVEQYVLYRLLQGAGIPYSAVTIDNLTVTAGEAALESGKVDAWLGVQPLVGLVLYDKKGRVLTTSAPGIRYLEYLVASTSALSNAKERAAIADFTVALDKSEAALRKDPALAAQTYVKTYGVPLSVAEGAVKSTQLESVPISSSIIAYQQKEADVFSGLGDLSSKLDVSKVFDLPLNRQITAAVKAP